MPVLIAPRIAIHSILTNLARLCKHDPQKGFYPPVIDLNQSQSTAAMLRQINTLLSYLQTPHLSYLNKPVGETAARPVCANSANRLYK